MKVVATLDATPERDYESYASAVYVLTSEPCESEGSSLPFGFSRHQSVLPALRATRDLPEPWMWWTQ